MIEIISKERYLKEVTTGRMSDGSDRVTQLIPVWRVFVKDHVGVIRELEFSGDPSADEVAQATPKPLDVTYNAKENIDGNEVKKAFEIWRMWQLTRIEAQARNAPAQLITALTNKEDAAWTNYTSILNRWRQAT